MRYTGIVRKIDGQGRIVPPKELRKSLHIQNGESLDISRDGNVLRIKQADGFVRGIVRDIDDIGRLSLPAEYRRVLKMDVGTDIEIYTDGRDICVRKYTPGCIICGSTKQLLNVDGVLICRDCGCKVVDKFMED